MTGKHCLSSVKCQVSLIHFHNCHLCSFMLFTYKDRLLPFCLLLVKQSNKQRSWQNEINSQLFKTMKLMKLQWNLKNYLQISLDCMQCNRGNQEEVSSPAVFTITRSHNFVHVFVFIHIYSASHSISLSEVLRTTAIDTVSEFTRRSATGNCKSRACPKSLRGT